MTESCKSDTAAFFGFYEDPQLLLRRRRRGDRQIKDRNVQNVEKKEAERCDSLFDSANDNMADKLSFPFLGSGRADR